jgi:biopolymer transport protein TolR
VGVPVDLPKTQAAAISKPDEPLIVTVTAEGKVYLQETEMADAQLVE